MKWPLGERDIEMLELLGEKEPKLVAEHFKIDVDALNSWIARCRQRKERFRWWLNRELAIEKKYPHVRRRMLPTRRKRGEE